MSVARGDWVLALFLPPSPLTDALTTHRLRRVLLLLARHVQKMAHDSLLAVRYAGERIALFAHRFTLARRGGQLQPPVVPLP
jgi:hypothetical protein